MATSKYLHCTQLVALIVAAFFLIPVSVSGQGPPPPKPGDRFRGMAEKNTRHKVEGPAGSPYRVTTSERYTTTSPSDSPFQRDTEYLCEGDDCDDTDELDVKLSNIAIKSSDKPINVFAPLAGLTDTLYSQVHADQLSSSLESPMVMYHATMLLTEPAVGSAINAAMLEGLGSVQNRYLAELHFANQLEQHPEIKEVLLRAYNSCIASNIRPRGKSLETDEKNDKIGWIKAQSQCMADRIASAAKLDGAEDFNDFNGSKPGDTGWGFNFMYDSANRKELEDRGLARDSYDEMYLTDYLFNETTSDKNELTWDEIDELKENFKAFIGDYVFRFDVNQSTSAGGGKRSASRSLQYERLPPDQNFQEWHREKEKEIYKTMMGLLKKKCEHNPDGGGPPLQDSHLLCSPNGGISDTEDFVKISVGSYQFDCAMLDMVFAQFAKTNPEVDSSDGDCAPFEVGFDVIKGKTDAKKRGHLLVAFLSSKIATAQIYSNMVLFQQILHSITPSDRGDSFLRTFSTQLLESAAGPHDYLNGYQVETQALNEKVRTEMQAQMAKDSGKAVRKFADVIHGSKTSAGTRGASPQQGK